VQQKTRLIDEKAEGIGHLVIQTIVSVRKAKSDANLSLKAPVKNLKIMGRITESDFKLIEKDLIAVTKAEKISYSEQDSKSEIDYEDSVEL